MNFFELFRRQVQVARVYGIPVRIDYRWFPVFAATVWLIALNFTTGAVRGVQASGIVAGVLSVLTTLLLFLSVFGHELAHALMARAEGIGTREIVLHPFGGLARLSHAPESARAEFRIAIAGPAASFIFSLLAFGAMTLAGVGGYMTAFAIFFVVGAGNMLLAFFNLLPGYPLDGGRVLRAILWNRTGDLHEATRLASLGGQVIAWTLIVIGAYTAVVWGAWFMGLWSCVIGLFLRDAATAVMRETFGAEATRGRSLMRDLGDLFTGQAVKRTAYDPARGAVHTGGRTAGEAMSVPAAIDPEMLVSHFVDNVLGVQRRARVPVARDDRLHGILTLEDLKRLPRERWSRTRVREVMRVVDADLFVDQHTPLAEAEEVMRRNGAGALAVVDRAGALIGFLQQRSSTSQSASAAQA